MCEFYFVICTMFCMKTHSAEMFCFNKAVIPRSLCKTDSPCSWFSCGQSLEPSGLGSVAVKAEVLKTSFFIRTHFLCWNFNFVVDENDYSQYKTNFLFVWSHPGILHLSGHQPLILTCSFFFCLYFSCVTTHIVKLAWGQKTLHIWGLLFIDSWQNWRHCTKFCS